jgi:hypothetical protein
VIPTADAKARAAAMLGQVQTTESSAAVAKRILSGPDAPAAQIQAAVDGKDGLQGPDGERGARGPAGPVGPAPEHEWDGTKLRFELPDGSWGEKVDLRGPKGEAGRDGVGGGVLVKQVAAAPSFGWMPGGWQ